MAYCVLQQKIGFRLCAVVNRFFSSFRFLLTLLCLLAFSGASLAFDVSGFGTLGMGRVSKSDATILDYDNEWSARSDTVLGLQIGRELADNLSLTTQIITEDTNHNNATDFDTKFEWFFLSYSYGGDTRVRIGRLRNPMLMFSDVLAVGYAQPWVRPPINIYIPELTTITNFDGVDIGFSKIVLDRELDFSAYLGVMDDKLTNLSVKADPILGTKIEWLLGDYRIRYSLGFARVTNSVAALEALAPNFNNLVPIAPLFSDLINAHRVEEEWFQQHGIGIQADLQDWTLIFEANTFRSLNSDVKSRTSGAYFSVARQFGLWMPYGVVGYTDNLYNQDLFDLLDQTYSVIPAGFNPSLDQLRGFAALVYNETKNSGFSWTMGCRYDFHPQAALKFEMQYFENQSHAVPASLPASTDSIVLSTILVDFVF